MFKIPGLRKNGDALGSAFEQPVKDKGFSLNPLEWDPDTVKMWLLIIVVICVLMYLMVNVVVPRYATYKLRRKMTGLVVPSA